ncbi:MAG TPA: hypothetical protein DCZ74_01820 [Treponema sp.]|nr:hypothetical protein [Treponema sp.]
MRRLFLKTLALLITAAAYAQPKPLYQLPETLPEPKTADSSVPFLLGTDKGVFRVESNGSASQLWDGGKVTQILRTTSSNEDGTTAEKWYFVTAKGIVSSQDLATFTECNNGLPFLTIKEYENGQKRLVKKAQLLKDLCADPMNPNILVTATKDAVYLTRNGGQNWESIGSTSRYTTGIKAVAVAHMPVYANDGSVSSTRLTVFMSHSTYGFSYCYPDSGAKWNDVSKGFGFHPSLTQPDEVSDILPVLCSDSNGNLSVEIYCAQTFLPNFYHFNWKGKNADLIYKGKGQAETIDSLCQVGDQICFATLGDIKAISLSDARETALPARYSTWKRQLYAAGSTVNAAFVPARTSGYSHPLQLNELWLLTPDSTLSPYDSTATDKKAVYISAYQVRNMTGINKYKKIVKDNNLNAVVVDMKDDNGLLRFTPNSELIKEKAYVSTYKIDLEQFVSEFKKDNVYLIGRVVVFKDKNLAEYKNGKYAVWNSATKAPWVGTRSYNKETGAVTYYDEHWVDPYSEDVWEYNAAIAQELIDRGFDEVQFDYIRFPTDGLNLSNASYRWKDAGMDKESALMSFLSYARKNITGPIGIDIYGANGWYRSGSRTGQDVEMLSEYVDVICPMFYPSHFEQSFLESAPVIERPYRIYFHGTYRNTVIGRNRIIVRPWVQAFYMGVRYDKAYYDKNYVRREVFGVRDSVDRGYMYWNNSGGMYDDISPDPAPDQASPWKENESALQYRLPAFSSSPDSREANVSNSRTQAAADTPADNSAMISILDSILYPVPDTPSAEPTLNSSLMLRVESFGKRK